MSVVEYKQVVIIDIEMSFVSMVIFMVKAALAAIPAFIILAIIGAVILGGLSGFTV